MADEYIRKQDALEALGKNPLKSMDGKGRYAAGRFAQWKKDKEKIKALESADVVPVVRCKDCRYRVDIDKCCHPDGMLRSKDNGFCSYGKRREE